MNHSQPYPDIEHRAPATLRPYARNARTHSKQQIRQIADSIERFGFTNPVLISEEDEIIAGHGRVAAAKLLGLTSVPTLRRRLKHIDRVPPCSSARSALKDLYVATDEIGFGALRYH